MKCYCERRGHCPWHSAITDAETFKACLEDGKPPPPAKKKPCIYLGTEVQRGRPRIDQPCYNCQLHDRCTIHPNSIQIAACDDCKDYLTSESKEVQTRFVDPLRVTGRDLKDTDALRNTLAGRSAFLVCGGPSVKKIDYKKLGERGIFSLGVNNVAGYVPVSSFVCSDPPAKFHHGIWSDPNIIKFVPTPKIGRNRSDRGKLRRKLQDGSFEWFDPDILCSANSPMTFGFERRSWLSCDETWFTEQSASWGNQNRGVKRFGERKAAVTMLLGLRLLQYLGARRIFLLGVDFHMSPKAGKFENYSFGEERDADAVASNNQHFEICNDWLIRLRPVFEKFGFHTYNCNPLSHLRAFDYVSFDLALEDCRGLTPKEPFDLSWWYCKDDNPKVSK